MPRRPQGKFLRTVRNSGCRYARTPQGLEEIRHSRWCRLACGHTVEDPYSYGPEQAWKPKECPLCREAAHAPLSVALCLAGHLRALVCAPRCPRCQSRLCGTAAPWTTWGCFGCGSFFKHGEVVLPDFSQFRGKESE